MKIRSGFVSNSSSSSFTCDICGENESGYDMCLSDAGMYMCSHGHTFCRSHMDCKNSEIDNIIKQMAIKEMRADGKTEEEIEDALEDYMDDIRCELDSDMPTNLCPCCTFRSPSEADVLKYLLVKADLTLGGAKNEMSERFKSIEEFERFLVDRPR